MKLKIILIISVLTILRFDISSQDLIPEIRDNSTLIMLREKLCDMESLMKKGIYEDKNTGRQYFSGYAYKTLYDWDQYFETITQIYMGWGSQYAKNGITIFLDSQDDTGFITRCVPSPQASSNEHVKPFLAQITLLIMDNYDDKEWFTVKYFEKMQRYIDYWLINMDKDSNGLSEWMSAPHSGMDNQHERAGYWSERVSEGVDLNCYLVRECRAFSKIAQEMGKEKIASEYQLKAESRAKLIRELMWDEEDGFFYDQFPGSGKSMFGSRRGLKTQVIRVKSIAGFAPLWAGVATPGQAKRLIYDHLMNPEEFWTRYPVPALAKSEPGYTSERILSDLGCSWRANTWIPTNYMIFHGLKDYGYDQIASLLANKTQELIDNAGCREYYLSDTAVGQGLDPFWGWSILGYFFEYEDQSVYDITKF